MLESALARFSRICFQTPSAYRFACKATNIFNAVSKNQPLRKRTCDGICQSAVVFKETIFIQQLVERQIQAVIDITFCPYDIRNPPPDAVEIHGKTFSNRRAVRTVYRVTHDVSVLVEAYTFYIVVVHGINLVGNIGKPVARFVVAVRSSDFFGRIAKIIADLKDGVVLRVLQIHSKHFSCISAIFSISFSAQEFSP